MSERVVRQKAGVVVVRSGLGQVVEYDVYLVDADGTRHHVGGGSKKAATKLFYKTEGAVS